MGSAGLIEIKRRIKSVQSTRKITKAMGLVATSKLRKARREISASEEHYNLSDEIVNEIVSTLPSDFDSPFLKPKKGAEGKLYVVMCSDTGLCGGFNGNVIASLSNSIVEKSNAKVVLVGAKGIPYLKKYGFYTVAEYVDIPDVPTMKEIKTVYNDVLNRFKSGEVSEVNIVYAKFISPIKQDVTIERLFPLEKRESTFGRYIIEPNVEEVVSSSLDVYFKSKIRRAMLNSKASEQSSRMTAMNGATENANDILQNLSIKYNRIRQGIITQEISEIVGGAEAQK